MAERADAARNRRAVLRAAEELLATRGAEHVSLDAVAAAAGVGKGTVFRRFGSRTGLMRALVEERMRSLDEGIAAGPPPLGPGAPPRERLDAFLAAVIEVASGNTALMAAYRQSLPNGEPTDPDRMASRVYRGWHAHVSGLIAAERPDLDAGLLGHLLLGALHGDEVRRLLLAGDTGRLGATLRFLVGAVLDAPAGG